MLHRQTLLMKVEKAEAHNLLVRLKGHWMRLEVPLPAPGACIAASEGCELPMPEAQVRWDQCWQRMTPKHTAKWSQDWLLLELVAGLQTRKLCEEGSHIALLWENPGAVGGWWMVDGSVTKRKRPYGGQVAWAHTPLGSHNREEHIEGFRIVMVAQCDGCSTATPLINKLQCSIF
jgi:hypothetical protein